MNALGAMVLAGLVVGSDAVLRGIGLYEAVLDDWPAAFRERRVVASDSALPFRAADAVAYEPVVGAGIPRSVTLPIAPAVLLTVMWVVCLFLALSELGRFLLQGRPAAHTVASLALVVVHAAAGVVTVGSVATRATRAFALSCGVVLALDAALAAFPLPCSDHRSDDVHIALAGLAVHVPLALAFAWNAWRRRGLVAPPAGAVRTLH